MKVQIVNTTDKKYIGKVFDDKNNPIVFDDVKIYFDKIIETSEGKIFANSNYIVETIKYTK